MSTYKVLHTSNINQKFVNMEGIHWDNPVIQRAKDLQKELENGIRKPFTEIVWADTADCQAMGQQPITFYRQIVALCLEPKLMDSPDYPEDAKARASQFLDGCLGKSIGAYTEVVGVEVSRRLVAKFLEHRDGYEADWRNICLRLGATGCIKRVLAMFDCEINGKKPAIMVPIPKHPLYVSLLAELGLKEVGYVLDETQNWRVDIKELKRSLDAGKKKFAVRALVVINPGNPTGQVLSRENIEEIIKFAHEEKLFLLADEVHQENVYDSSTKFHSFKKVLMDMGAPYNQMELASFMSVSHGYLNEAGLRGGFMEIVNMCPESRALLMKIFSSSGCPTTPVQLAIGVLANPPQPDEVSYDLFVKEKSEVLTKLKLNAEMVSRELNSIEGVCCTPVQASLYAFPRVELPEKAVESARRRGVTPGTFYALELLESTGICIIPDSSVFDEQSGTFHFRMAITMKPLLLEVILQKFKKFHHAFLNNYS